MPRWARVLLLLVACAAPFVRPDGAGASETASAQPSAASWYPSGVGTVTAATYPDGTLHVGSALGQETDRTYLRFDLPVPSDADVRGATVTARLDPDAGTSSPESAVVLACKVPGGFDPEATAPAPVDCDGAPKAHVTADAISVEIDATSPTVDVALVPGGGDTWHLGFESPTAVATYDVVASPPQPTSMPTSTPRRATFATSSPLAGTPMALPPITVAPPAAVGRDIADAARAAVTAPPVVGATPVPTGGGFRYAVVFALPLVLLVVIGALGHGLTRPVRLREDAA